MDMVIKINGEWMVFDCEKLQNQRVMRKLDRTKLAKAAGCTDTALEEWESGKGAPSEVWLRRLAEVLRCKVGDLAKRYVREEDVKPVEAVPVEPKKEKKRERHLFP